VWNGKNIYDFVDPDIETKLAALEEEEEKLEAEGYYDSDESVEDAEDADIRMKADLIREKRTLMRNEAKMRKSLKNRAQIPRSAKSKKLSEMEHGLDAAGYDVDAAGSRARSQSQARGRPLTRSEPGDDDAMDLDDPHKALARAKSRARSQAATDRRNDGVVDETARSKADRLQKLGQKKMNRMARQGEADRHTTVSLVKHLVCTLILDLIRSYNPSGHFANSFDTGRWKAWYWQEPASLRPPRVIIVNLVPGSISPYRVHNGVWRCFSSSIILFSFRLCFPVSFIGHGKGSPHIPYTTRCPRARELGRGSDEGFSQLIRFAGI
jgi:hypothetical protein